MCKARSGRGYVDTAFQHRLADHTLRLQLQTILLHKIPPEADLRLSVN